MSYRSNEREIAAVSAPSIVVAIFWLFCAAVAQSTILHAFAFRNAVPSFVLIVVVLYALRVGITRGVLIGTIGGLFEDALSGGTGGAWTISSALLALVAGWTSRFFFSDAPPALIGAVALGSLLRSAFFWSIMSFGGYPPGLGGAHLHQAILQALYAAIAATPIILFLEQGRERPVKRIPLRDFRG